MNGVAVALASFSGEAREVQPLRDVEGQWGGETAAALRSVGSDVGTARSRPDRLHQLALERLQVLGVPVLRKLEGPVEPEDQRALSRRGPRATTAPGERR